MLVLVATTSAAVLGATPQLKYSRLNYGMNYSEYSRRQSNNKPLISLYLSSHNVSV